MPPGDIEGRIILKTDQFQRSIENAKRQLTAIDRWKPITSVNQLLQDGVDGRMQHVGKATSMTTDAMLGLATAGYVVKKSLGFGADAMRRYAETSQTAKSNMDRLVESFNKLKVGIGRDLSMGVSGGGGGLTGLIDGIEKGRQAAVDFWHDWTPLGRLMAIGKDGTAAGKTKRQTEDDHIDLETQQMLAGRRARQDLLVKLLEAGNMTTEEKEQVAIQRAWSQFHAEQEAIKSDPLVMNGEGDNQRGGRLRLAAQIRDAAIQKAHSDANTAIAQYYADQEKKAKEAAEDGEHPAEKLMREKDEAFRKQREKEDASWKARMTIETEGLASITARTAAEETMLKKMDLQLRYAERIRDVGRDLLLTEEERASTAAALVQSRDAQLMQMDKDLDGRRAITGGRGSVGLSGSTFAQAQSGAVNRQNDLLRSNNDQLKAIKASIDKLAQNGMVGVYGP